MKVPSCIALVCLFSLTAGQVRCVWEHTQLVRPCPFLLCVLSPSHLHSSRPTAKSVESCSSVTLTRWRRRRWVCCSAGGTGTAALPSAAPCGSCCLAISEPQHCWREVEHHVSTGSSASPWNGWQCPLPPRPWHFGDVLHPMCTEQLAKGTEEHPLPLEPILSSLLLS